MAVSTVAERLRKLRILSGKSQIIAAKESGIDRWRLSMAENGHLDLTPAEVSALEGVLLPVAQSRHAELGELFAVGATA